MSSWLFSQKHLIISLLWVTFWFLLFFPTKYVNVDESNYWAAAELIAKQEDLKQECNGLEGQFPIDTVGEGNLLCVYKYNIGTSIFLVPAAALGSTALAVVTSLVMYLVSIFFFSRILSVNKLDERFIYLYAFFPPYLYFTRTILSEIYSVTLMAVFIYLVQNIIFRLKRGVNKGSVLLSILLGATIGLAVLVRYSNVLIIACFLLFLLWKEREFISQTRQKIGVALFGLISGGVPFLLFFLWINTYLYGGAFTSGYSLSGEQVLQSNLLIILTQVLAYLLALNLMYPGMVFISVYEFVKGRWAEFSAASFIIIIFYILGPNTLFEVRLLDLILGIRFIVPSLPFLLVPYFSFLQGKTCLCKSKWPFIIIVVTLALLGVLLNYYHSEFLTLT